MYRERYMRFRVKSLKKTKKQEYKISGKVSTCFKKYEQSTCGQNARMWCRLMFAGGNNFEFGRSACDKQLHRRPSF